MKHSLIFGLGIACALFSSIQCHFDLFPWWWKVMLCFNPPLHDHYSFLFLPFSLTTRLRRVIVSLLLRLRRISTHASTALAVYCCDNASSVYSQSVTIKFTNDTCVYFYINICSNFFLITLEFPPRTITPKFATHNQKNKTHQPKKRANEKR